MDAPKAASCKSSRREHPTLVGLFRYGPHGNHVLPYDVRLNHEVLIPPGDELTPELRAKLGSDAQQQASSPRRIVACAFPNSTAPS